MAITRFSLKARTRSGAQMAQRAVQYLTREGPYAPAHSVEPAQREVSYLVRETAATRARDDLVWQQVGNLPVWAQGSASQFFEAAVAYERTNGRWGIALQAALPRELSREQQMALTHDFLHAHLPDKPYLVVMHEPRTATGETQPHIHVLFSERSMDGIEREEAQFFKRANRAQPERGGAAKDLYWHERRCPGRIRQAWVDLTNYHLERAGHDVRVDARSLYARGIEREPERKAGWQREGSEHREQVQQARTQTDAREQQLAREHWEQRKQGLGITNVHDLSPEAMQAKSRAWARDGQPGRAIPPRSLEELQNREAAHERLMQQQEVYVNRLHAEVMMEEHRQRTGRPRSAQAEVRIERLLAEGAAPEHTARQHDGGAHERTDWPGGDGAGREQRTEQGARRQVQREQASEQQAQEQVLAGVEEGMNGIDDTPGHGATFRIRDKERDLGHSR